MKYFTTLTLLLISISSCSSDKDKDFVPTSVNYITINKTSHNVKIKSYLMSNLLETDSINPFETISVSGLNDDPSDGIYMPSYVRGDSVLLIFNNEKFIYYQRDNLTYNYVNQKNIIDLESWDKENLSSEKLKKFLYTFQITEEDYALAEDL